jgi:hypothetical protein
MTQKNYAKNRDLLLDWIDEQWALRALMPGYIMDPVDTDKERCFV